MSRERRAEGQGAMIALLFMTPIILGTILIIGYVLSSSAANTIAHLRESKREAERARENIVVYIHKGPDNGTLVSIEGAWSGESVVDLVLARRGGTLLQEEKRIVIPARSTVVLKPSHLIDELAAYEGNYTLFRTEVAGIMLHTELGNTFASGWERG